MNQSPAGGWGETPGSETSVAHTSLALLALAACGVPPSSVTSAFETLTAKVMDGGGDDSHAFMETYNITAADQQHRWRETMHHHGLALAAAALLRHPRPPARALRRCYQAILSTQRPGGEWTSRPEAPAPALWPTWHCLLALFDLRNNILLRPGDTLVWLDHAVAVRRASGGRRSLSSLVRAPRATGTLRFARRRWAGLVLAVATTVALAMAVSGVLSWADALLALLLPVLLLIVQETLVRTRPVK